MAFSTINGGSGNDSTSFIGTSGIDTISIKNDTTATSVFLGGQNEADSIGLEGLGAKSNYTLRAGQGNDVLTTTGTTLSKSVVNGNKGDDTLGTATNGFNVNSEAKIYGGADNDTLFISSASSGIANGNKGNDALNLLGASTASSMFGGAGTDTINAGSGAIADTLIRGDLGNDQISVSTSSYSNSTINGMAGADLVEGSASTAALLLAGGEDNDTVRGGSGADVLNGGVGNDQLKGNAGADQLNGGDGNDSFVYSADTDLFSGASQLIDQIIGGTGINGVSINNNNVNGNGNTTFNVDATDVWTGLSNVSSISALRASNQIIDLDLDRTAYTVGIRSIDLSADTDATATNVIDVSEFIAGENVSLTGSSGVDSINTGLGADTINGLAGANNILSGQGLDTINVTTTNTNTVSLNATGAANLTTVLATGGAARTTSVVAVAASGILDQRATAAGSTVGVTFDGSGGGVGTYNFTGGGGADAMTGDAAADTITAGGGTDTITGGAGADSLTGDAGADTFIYNNIGATFVGVNADTIVDFAQGAGGDVLSLTAAAFVGLAAGQTNVFTAVAGAANLATNVLVDTTGNLAAANIANTRLAYDTTLNRWFYDADGNWGAGAVAFATSTNALTALGLDATNVIIA